MKRKDFLRNAMMALAVSFVPKILQPLAPEITEGECVFNEAKINEQLRRLREYPLTPSQCMWLVPEGTLANGQPSVFIKYIKNDNY